MRIGKNTFQTLLVKGGVAAINMVIVFLTLNVLGAEGRGEISLFVTDLSLILMVVSVLSGSTVAYHVKKVRLRSLIKVAYLWTLIIAIPLSLLLMYLHPESLQYHLYPITVLYGFFSTNQMVFIGKNEIKRYNFLFCLVPFLLISVLLIFFYVFDTQTTYVYVIGLYVSVGIGFVISSVYVFSDCLKGDLVKERIPKSIYKYGLGNELSVGIHFLNNRFLYYVVYHFLGNSTLGIFSVAVSIVESVLLISKSVSVNQYSEILIEKEEGNKVKITDKALKDTFKYTALCLLVLVMIPAEALSLIIDNDAQVVKKCILFLAPGMLFLSVTNIFGNYFSGLGRYTENILKSIVGFVFMLTIGFLFKDNGMTGASLAMSGGYLFSFFVLLFLYLKKRKNVLFFANS